MQCSRFWISLLHVKPQEAMTKFFFFDSPGNTAATAAERKAEESGWETVSKHTNNTLCGVMNPPWFILYLYNFDPLDHGCRLLFFGFFLFPTGCVRRQESRRPREIQWKRNKRKTKRHRNYLLKQHFVICLREIKVRYIFLKTTSRGLGSSFFVCLVKLLKIIKHEWSREAPFFILRHCI